MAQNTVEDTKSAVDKTEMSETSTRTIDKADPRDDKENADEAMDATNAESTSEGIEESIKKEKVDDNSIDPKELDSKEQPNIRETDLEKKPKEEKTDAEKESSSEKTIKTETKENELEENCSTETSNDADERVNALSEAEERLSEILKVVHEDLDIKYFQKSARQSTSAKDNGKDKNDKEQQAKKVETVEKQDNATDTAMESAASVTVERAEEKRDSKESSEKSEEKPEVGIVGPPTAVSELLNEEELGGGDSADQKDHIAEWVEKSAKEDTPTPANAEDEDNVTKECKQRTNGNDVGTKWKNEDTMSISSRKSQKIVSNIIKKSIKCLNKMHAMEGASGNGKNVDAAENAPNTSPKVPQSQQNGAALPEETAASPSALDYGRVKIEKDVKINKKSLPVTSTPIASTSQQKAGSSRLVRSKSAEIVGKKRKSPDVLRDSTNGPPKPKKSCCSFEERETSIKSLVGEDRTADALRMRESELLKRMQFLEKLAKDKEKEWNQILYTRKLTEEAYVRIQRKKHMMRLTNSTTQLDDVPPTSLEAKWLNSDGTSMETGSRERTFEFKSDLSEESSLNASSTKKQNVAKAARQSGSSKSGGENSRKQSEQTSSPETRQIGEGRQGARVEVTSIIANHRKMFPDPAPKRGRRTRNAVNVNLTAGGALVETGHNADSRPSSTDSCKSNPSATECQNVNFKDMVLQFNRLSQHTVGEPARAPQNYPDVTLQPVPSGHNASPVPENTTAPSRSLLHGILTNNTSSRPNNFPLTLAKLLTAPERERNSPAVAAVTATTPMVPMSQQSASTQHLLQAYQGSSLGSISELLSSPTARTEITITPVVNTPAQSHSNNVINVVYRMT
ncbi:PREDICTED: uncharacterized protein LOC106751400 isoform X2 [Dinoponera quadriceps]|uniref:Uncharacterized protein LOC106751400 isoform X2 n=1 Tax=Dinoponera quadriceps TaxID=609295 RepID=A0A6P3YD24_DINQU|nr:PREDICTED: uncharacterized protein LOC106751400 isoform X2 [Dinoponera quadriceps]